MDDTDKFIMEKLRNFKIYCLSFLDAKKDEETIKWINSMAETQENLDKFKGWIIVEIKPIAFFKDLVCAKCLLKTGASSQELKRFSDDNKNKVYGYMCLFSEVI